VHFHCFCPSKVNTLCEKRYCSALGINTLRQSELLIVTRVCMGKTSSLEDGLDCSILIGVEDKADISIWLIQFIVQFQ